MGRNVFDIKWVFEFFSLKFFSENLSFRQILASRTPDARREADCSRNCMCSLVLYVPCRAVPLNVYSHAHSKTVIQTRRTHPNWRAHVHMSVTCERAEKSRRHIRKMQQFRRNPTDGTASHVATLSLSFNLQTRHIRNNKCVWNLKSNSEQDSKHWLWILLIYLLLTI